ncbi:MAG: DUF4143 domain-containing protein [Bacteroidales bacterium]|nr:DUF4143 domain-containing protein [Bacteroidales bacterium]
MNGDISVNEGALVENQVACALSSKGIPLHYYDHKSRQELDFVYPFFNKVNIIEVKSGSNYRQHASLNAAVNSFGNRIGRSIVLGPCIVEQINSVVYLPLYMSMFL